MKRGFVFAGLMAGLVGSPACAAALQGGVVVGSQEVPVLLISGAPDFTPSFSITAAQNGASAFAIANLDSGALKGGISSLTSPTGGFFQGAVSERFSFTGVTTDTPIFLSINFAGAVTNEAVVRLETKLTSQGNLSDSVLTLTNGSSGASFVNATFLNGATAQTDLQWAFEAPSTVKGSATYLLPFLLTADSSTVDFYAQVTGVSRGFSAVDFGHSAHFGFVLPDAVEFTSTTGTSFTRPEALSTVPEPTTWALMIVGFGSAGSMLRRRRSVLGSVEPLKVKHG